MERALEHAQEQKPDLLITGGDLIMDALSADKERMKAQWDLYRRVLKGNISVPVEQCIGNHDVWGWNNPQLYKGQSGYGKSYALDVLELERPYRSFDRGGWHFVVLDSTYPKTVGYTAKLDNEQFEWLEDDLRKNTQRPTMIVSHIPILSACVFFDGPNEERGNWRVPGAWMHIDARRLKDLFWRFKNVKACISGHIHLQDHLHYLGVAYFCNGAVCGAWWKGDCQEVRPGYAIMDLFDDGHVSGHYSSYGWSK